MCGIAGFTRLPGETGGASLGRIVDALHHRGPDDSGALVDRSAGIGMARLSIVGIANGHQPILSEDGRRAIVGNGEIYDAPMHRPQLEALGHRFATDSDIETLLHLYEEHGEDAFSRVNGMFAVAILERDRGRVLIARDRLGIKPLFYARVGEATIFASEIGALRAGLPPAADLSLDPEALGDYLAHGYVPSPRTIDRGIRRLPPGHLLWLDESAPNPRAWWSLPEYTPEERPLEEWSEAVAGLIEDSVRRRTLGDVPAGAFLSGGLDSSTMLACLSRQTSPPVPTFTLGFAEASHDEREIARGTAEAFGADPHESVLTAVDADEIEALFRHLGEPFGDVSILPTDRVAKLASGTVKFVLSGDGGDELFGGYPWFTREARWRNGGMPGAVRGACRAFGPWLRHGQRATGSGLFGRGMRFLGDLASDSAGSFLRRRRLASSALITQLVDPALRSAMPVETTLAAHAARWPGSEPELWLDLDRRFYLAGDILEKVDRATMRHSLEARVPLLDHRLVEVAARIPVTTHLGPRHEGKHVLRAAMARLLPAELFDRPKRGFGMPVDRWLRGHLREPLRDRLLDSSFRDQGILDSRAVERILDRHDQGRADHGHLLWALWSLAVWAESSGVPSPARERNNEIDLIATAG